MTRPRATRLLKLLFVLLPWVAACDTTVSGKNDVLRFRYDADDSFLPSAFNTPLGAGLGARVEVFIDPDGSGAAKEVAAPVLDASSSDAAVGDGIAAKADNVITLAAHEAGSAEVSVQTARGNDVFDVRVVDVAKVDLSHPGVLVSDNPPSKGVAGGTARFIVALKDVSGAAAVGFGALSATVDPPEAAEVQASTVIGFVPVKFDKPGPATITGLNDEPLTLDIVAQTDLTNLELKGPDTVTTLPVGGQLAAVLRGITANNERAVGVASIATVAVTDTSICTVSPQDPLGEGAYLIVGKAAGTCPIAAHLGDLSLAHEVQVKAL